MSNLKEKILIIEDEEVLASVLLAKFKMEKYDVKVEHDGESGLARIKEWRPDLILLDIVMPKMNGYEVLEKMKEDNVKIPIIIISNSGQLVELEKTKKLGAVDCIIKTELNPGEVIEKVKNYLNKDKKGQDKKESEKVNQIDNKGGPVVLIVEDDSFLRDICTKKLIKEGFRVIAAIDGEQALKDIEKNKIDIILLDIILPAIDGFEVLKKIRSHKKTNIKNVPVIMLSNLGQDDDISKAMDLGANGYLIKAHFTTDEIVEKIKKELTKK